ncbi:hypothetical protein [Mucilaginibacter sp. R-33]|uniref:hypothetical protein n=1 Tax=Mucilaginibacter sp. R-33 TaxID=3416711 RepID=UPI003CEFF769
MKSNIKDRSGKTVPQCFSIKNIVIAPAALFPQTAWPVQTSGQADTLLVDIKQGG